MSYMQNDLCKFRRDALTVKIFSNTEEMGQHAAKEVAKMTDELEGDEGNEARDGIGQNREGPPESLALHALLREEKGQPKPEEVIDEGR